MANELNILIAMPIYRQMLYIQTLSSLMALKDTFKEIGVDSTFIYVDSYDIVSARNMMSTYFYNNKNFTHLLFVDDDMLFHSESILELLRIDRPLAGCICPMRKLDANAVYAAALDGKPLEQAKASALEFVVAHQRAEQLVVDQNFCKLNGIGMAVTLIRRDVFDKFISDGAARKTELSEGKEVDVLGNAFHYDFFDRVYYEPSKGWLGEDYSFCHKWRTICGGEIFGLVTAKIGHVGSFVFEGRYIDSLQAGKL
ncbi:MAG: hypothetical protein K2P80_14685 [Beijerinckiaceae bacterium]|nr:hypothetical protein [Beijerinckiaceae bacterium]